MTEPSSSSSGDRNKKGGRAALYGLALLVIVAVGAYAIFYYLTNVRKPLEENVALNEELVRKTVGLSDAKPMTLDPRYADANGDEVADPPKDSKEMVDPPTLLFSYVAVEGPEKYKEAFSEFVSHMSKVTGKPVEYSAFKNPGAEIKAMREGKLHVAGFNTGNVPLAVNWAGFVPVGRLASADGVSTYQMEIIVPTDSDAQSVPELRGHELTLTEAGSNSGFKAPLVVLTKDNGLRPVTDFKIRYSGGHTESIQGIASKQYEAAAVANDILSRELGVGTIKKEQYRTIYKSKDFPTAGFGYAYNLKPELAAKVKEALFSFNWKGTKLEKEFAASNQSKFVPVDYKNDWALVKRIDSEIRGTQSLESVLAAAEAADEEPSTQAVGEPTTAPATTGPQNRYGR